jgi:hypothetical protein
MADDLKRRLASVGFDTCTGYLEYLEKNVPEVIEAVKRGQDITAKLITEPVRFTAVELFAGTWEERPKFTPIEVQFCLRTITKEFPNDPYAMGVVEKLRKLY